jgi:hypothetical protein
MEDQHHPGGAAVTIADRRGRVSNGHLRPIPPQQQYPIGQVDRATFLKSGYIPPNLENTLVEEEDFTQGQPVAPLSPFNDTAAPDFLRDNLVRRGAAFDFMVQLRAHPDAMPIEDPTIEWSESAAPFVPVARVTIAPQEFDQPTQRAFCENLSFTPWHGLDAHRPLGGINRVRRTVYETVSQLRHELNGVVRQEPTSF